MARHPAVVFTALAAVFLAHLVGADDGQPASDGPNPETLFKQLDANADGQLSLDEAGAQHRRLLNRLLRRHDEDGNGKLSLAEFTAGLKEAPPEIPADEPRAPGEPNEQLGKFLQADSDELFKKLDANGDGKLELDELQPEGRPQFVPFFERADVDRDKALTLEEFRKGHAQVRQYLGTQLPGQGSPGQGQGPPRPGAPGQTLYRALDLDGDGTLSADEIARASDSLKKLDQDGDGTVTRRELVRGGQAAGMPPRPGIAPGAGPGGGPNAQRLMARLKQMDKDGDGKWKPDELPPFLRQRFNQIDANGDGFVDADELRRGADLMQQRTQQGGGRDKPNQPGQG